MKACGVKNLNVVINQSSIKKILSDNKEKFPHAHNLSIQELKELPKQLQKPIMALKRSHENSVVFVTDIKDVNNNEILISVDVDTTGYKQNVNRVTSMYGKDNITNYLRIQLDNGNLIGYDKKRANQMLSTKGLQLPPATTFTDYINIISDSDKNVNTEIIAENQIANQLNKQLDNAEEMPTDILCDDSKIQWYSFANGINDTEKVKETLQKIQAEEKQVVSVLSDGNINQLIYLNDELQLIPYSDHIFPSADAALKTVLENDNIAKLVPYETMLQASVEQKLTVLSECANKKYPFIKITWSDNTELAQDSCLPLDKAEKLFTDINAGHYESLRQRTNLSLFLDDMNTYNLDVDLGAESGGINDHISQLIDDSNISSDKSIQHLQEYLKENGLLTEQELQLEQAKQMNLFDFAEIT